MGDEANCYPGLPLSSSSLWLESSPFNATVPLLLAQVATIVAISESLHSVLRHLGQPIVVSQIITGLILGPSGLSRFSFFRDVLFSEQSWIQLNMLVLVGLILFRFIIGLKTDITMLRTTRYQAVMVALSSRAMPLVFIVVFKTILNNSLPQDIIDSDIITGISVTWTLSSFIVITWLLNEFNLLNSKIGRLAISASLLDNLVDIIYHLVTTTINNTRDGSAVTWVGVIFSFVGLIVFIVTVARPVTLWIIKRTPEGEQLDEKYFVAILVLALGCGLLSEMIGYHAGVGMLLLGLALPSGPPLGYTMVERLEGVITSLSIPVLMAKPGFLSDVSTLVGDVSFWGYLQFFIILSVVGKFVGVVLCSMLLCKLPSLEAIPLALIMCTKGFYEVELILMWEDQQMIDLRIATTFTVSIAFIAGVTTPMIKALYRPSTQYVDHNLRTIEHYDSKQHNGELRIMTCVHGQENVSPLLRLVETVYPNPNCPVNLVLLHLVPLVGRTTTVLAPYNRNNTNNPAGSDHIVNAFQQFNNQDNMTHCVSLQPFVSISPPATMHDDVCTLALDKQVSLVLLPFHKASTDSAGTTQQMINTKVVDYAPCSIAILVINGSSANSTTATATTATSSSSLTVLFENVAVYFLGGADDRESIALSMHMAENPNVNVTVFRFRAPNDPSIMLDEEVLEKVKGHERMGYREEVVDDGEQLTTVIQSTNRHFDLLVVGRREGMECPLTSGLSVWSESPELGILGDMIVSTDFNCNASVLVVQQQLKVGAVGSTVAQPVIDEDGI